jgi:hypothetical protein
MTAMRRLLTLVTVVAMAVLAYDGVMHPERRGAGMLFVFIGLIGLAKNRRRLGF